MTSLADEILDQVRRGRRVTFSAAEPMLIQVRLREQDRVGVYTVDRYITEEASRDYLTLVLQVCSREMDLR